MRFVFEHPWPVSIAILIVAVFLGWTALQEGFRGRLIISLAMVVAAAAALAAGILVDTPREHARAVTRGFIAAVVRGDVDAAAALLSPHAVIIDDWEGIPANDKAAMVMRLRSLHRQYDLVANTTLRLEVAERDMDAVVEVSLLTRIGSIGSVPSRWRLTLAPEDDGQWRIRTLDAIMVAGRPYQ